MKARSLSQTYSVCGKTFELCTKTGRYKGRDYGYLEISSGYGDAEETFEIERVNLFADIGLELKDRISIVKFGEDGPFFLAYNHRNSKYEYYPEAVRDLYWTLKSGWIASIFNAWRLNKAAQTFATTRAFSRILREVQAL